ncbi:MAG: Peptidyl-prolyl cis-trans isomerase [Candidatus Hydrogenedentes bacterium]|nr:Peptidyl-prolyl cis-trans isomerase [Candidatus Hydrogenedentota bacterium]
MSDPNSDRLQSFRAQYSAPKTGPGRLAIVQLIVLVAGFAGVFAILLRGGETPEPSQIASGGGLAAETQRDYAAYLAERQHPAAAIAAYQAYLDKATLDAPARAKVCYSMAKAAMDAQLYDDALTYFYQAEFLEPESELKDEIDKKVVTCLDKLGRQTDLRKELRKRTQIKRTPDDVKEGEKVLAEFAGEVITDRDLDIEIEKMPAYMRDSIDGPEKKADFLKNLVAQRLLLDKAQRLELDKTPEIQDQLTQQLDQLMVQKLITDEVDARISVTDEDVDRFYKAEPAKFTDPATVEVRVAKADTAEAVQAIETLPEKPVTVRKGGAIPGVPASPEAVEALFAAEPEGRVGPYELDKAWYLFQVVSKTPERLKPFEEVRDQAKRMFEMQKRQEELNALIERILNERDVQLHLDRLQEQPAQEQPAQS